MPTNITKLKFGFNQDIDNNVVDVRLIPKIMKSQNNENGTEDNSSS